MRRHTSKILKLAVTALFISGAWAAEVPRAAPDLAVPLPDGKTVKVSEYRGKVLCLTFILTTCPHCQKTTQLLEGIYKDFGPKGFNVLQVALNQNPDIPGFISRFQVPFPVGTGGVLEAVDYIQWPKDKRPLVPFVVFIDRKGMIRAQYTGVDESFFDANQDQHMRDEVTKLIGEGGAPAKPKPARKPAG
jgi:peroxiredoxin